MQAYGSRRGHVGTVVLFALMTFVCLGAGIAAAQSVDDSLVQHDRAQYIRAGYADRLSRPFQPHARVCTDAASGDAACNARVVTDTTGLPLASSVPGTALRSAQLRSAYGVTGLSSAANPPIIAIVDAYDHPNIQSDLNTYSSVMGIPSLPSCKGTVASASSPCLKKSDERGGTRYPRGNAGWDLEISLDVEAAHAMCQNCSILLVEADSASYADLMAAVDRAVALGAKIVSNSYGSSEFSGETFYDSHFNKPGVTFTFSSGDNGYGVEYPAASRYVTAVGGTTLFLNPDGSYNSESAWAGAGSGCSAYEAKQPWQIDAKCPRRAVADVSAVADPNTGMAVYDSVAYAGQKGWFQVGGTSLAAPVVASIYALANNVTTSVPANAIPYSASSGTLHDIVSGTNGTCGTYLCAAVAGYDGPTGLGSPLGFTAL